MNLQQLQSLSEERLRKIFNFYLKEKSCVAPVLQEAMTYAVFNGGKRLRPQLVYATGFSFSRKLEKCDYPAAAVELIHAYSLVHDDLPAMDNSDLRRGKPTCHKVFGDAMAVLAGDALQTLAFEMLTTGNFSNAEVSAMTQVLAEASGYQGMAGGQALDILGVKTIAELEQMYLLKTGALLNASLQLGAIAASQNSDVLARLKIFGNAIGLAFQIQDDLLDLQSSKVTGKSSGLDTTNGKVTYPVLVGEEKTRERVAGLFDQACGVLDDLNLQSDILRQWAGFVMDRCY